VLTESDVALNSGSYRVQQKKATMKETCTINRITMSRRWVDGSEAMASI
jgi:hypothetical protein